MRDHPGYVKWVRFGTVATAWLFAACVALQVFLAGLAVFDPSDGPAHWADHTDLGRMIGALTVLLLILAIVGRVSVILIALSVLVLLLYGAQYAFANADASNMAALHAVNALVLFWLSMTIGARTWSLARASNVVKRDA